MNLLSLLCIKEKNRFPDPDSVAKAIQPLGALIVVAEIGDINRFENQAGLAWTQHQS